MEWERDFEDCSNGQSLGMMVNHSKSLFWYWGKTTKQWFIMVYLLLISDNLSILEPSQVRFYANPTPHLFADVQDERDIFGDVSDDDPEKAMAWAALDGLPWSDPRPPRPGADHRAGVPTTTASRPGAENRDGKPPPWRGIDSQEIFWPVSLAMDWQNQRVLFVLTFYWTHPFEQVFYPLSGAGDHALAEHHLLRRSWILPSPQLPGMLLHEAAGLFSVSSFSHDICCRNDDIHSGNLT